MKIQTKVGNLLDVTAGHIVHGCNAQGVMGSGVALAIKKKYPEAFRDYRNQFEKPVADGGGLILGVAYPSPVNGQLFVWNAITQEGFGAGVRQVSYDAIETCFSQINEDANRYSLLIPAEIHIPAIGAGLGGGNWEIIREIIEQTVTVPTTLWILPT
jgi:O-acetyl-ADP-ribose deacetylase (regulator of RNase III)